MLFPLRDFHPSSTLPIVTYSLIAINVIVFIIQYFSMGNSLAPEIFVYRGQIVTTATDYFLFKYSVTPCELFGSCEALPSADFPIVLTLITSTFLHGGLAHLVGNMWFLWVFGDNVEDSMGKFKFIGFYLIGGLAASLAQILIDPGSNVPMVGASGAIAAVLGGYLVLFPNARILTLFFIVIFFQLVRLPAVFLLGYWFLIQVFSSLVGSGSQVGGGVAYMAHIGGFVAGALLIRSFVKKRRDIQWEP